ncbi:MAG: hypothetical protein LBE12_13135 [Planctomycetaceae bacterium]|nr:hypothetical protein [Planctomycetaceae bacterium]
MIIAVYVLLLSGCGTTKWSDTGRTGTEQLLISNAIDNAVGKIDFTPIGDKYVFLKTDAINEATDYKYLAMALRQQMAACGGVICDKEEDADYIVEIRVGAIGTDRDDMLIGVPALTFPSIPGTGFTAGTIPEIPFIKRTKQRGIAKIAVFAYNKRTGRPLWASGNKQSESQARNLWFAGTGPLTRGTIYDETTFAGHRVPEFLESKRDRYLKSFADRAIIFHELQNEPTLKNRYEKKVTQTDKTNKTIISTPEIPRYSAVTPTTLPATSPVTSPATVLPIFQPPNSNPINQSTELLTLPTPVIQ